MGFIALVWCVLVLRCGLAGMVWYPDAGWSTASACIQIPHQPAKPQRNSYQSNTTHEITSSGSSHNHRILSDYIHVRWFEHQRILLFALIFRNIIKFVVSLQPQPIFAVLSRNRVSVVLCSESHFRSPLSESHFRGSLLKFYLYGPHFRISF